MLSVWDAVGAPDLPKLTSNVGRRRGSYPARSLSEEQLGERVVPPLLDLVGTPAVVARRRAEALERDDYPEDRHPPLDVDSRTPHAGGPGGEGAAALVVATSTALVVRRSQLGILAPPLRQDAKHVTGTLVEPTIETDEGAQLPDGVAGPLVKLRDRSSDVGALLRSVDQRVRQPGLGAVDAVDGGLGDTCPLRHRPDTGPRPTLLQESGTSRGGDEFARALCLVLAQLGTVSAGGAHENHCTGSLIPSIFTEHCLNESSITQ